MQRALETVYGLGRLAFGAGLMGAPRGFGGLLLGEEASAPAVRITLRTYGTRDVVLGVWALQAIARDRDAAGWIAGGLLADLLDTAVQLGEWSDLPADKRVVGVLAALAAAGAGITLLARRER